MYGDYMDLGITVTPDVTNWEQYVKNHVDMGGVVKYNFLESSIIQLQPENSVHAVQLLTQLAKCDKTLTILLVPHAKVRCIVPCERRPTMITVVRMNGQVEIQSYNSHTDNMCTLLKCECVRYIPCQQREFCGMWIACDATSWSSPNEVATKRYGKSVEGDVLRGDIAVVPDRVMQCL